jgi:hypothetical protein
MFLAGTNFSTNNKATECCKIHSHATQSGENLFNIFLMYFNRML